MDLLICAPVEEWADRYIVPGSIESTCQDCGVSVYVAPTGQKIMDQMIVVCSSCGLARLESDPSPQLTIPKGAIEEIKTYQNRN